MALGTYQDLQDAIQSWLEDEDLNARIPDFIALAEARFNRELKLREMENRQTQDDVAFAKEMPLPAGYLSIVRFTGDGPWPIVDMEWRPPNVLHAMQSQQAPGRPRYYSVHGNSMHISPEPDANPPEQYTYTLDYREKIPALSDSNTTNWLLDKAPDLYLYGSLLEAEAFTQNDSRVAFWVTAYDRARTSLQAQDARSRYDPVGRSRRTIMGVRDGKPGIRG